jgi:hypothetical protein
MPIYKVVAKLRCNGWTSAGKCRGRPATVVLAEVWRHRKSGRAVHEIDVTTRVGWARECEARRAQGAAIR